MNVHPFLIIVLAWFLIFVGGYCLGNWGHVRGKHWSDAPLWRPRWKK